jgi:polysaccharide pyruvyl transferase WcaK-like protein
MEIRLINAYSTRNLGDAAIYAAFCQLSPATRASVDLADANPTLVSGLEIKTASSNEDVTVSVGGDIFNNGRPGLITRNFLSNLKDLAANPHQTFLFGQSIPPSCYGIAFSLLTRAMRKLSSVVVRDEHSFNLLHQAGVPAKLSYDTAFALSPSNAAIQAALASFDELQVEPAKAALISLRGGSPLYDADEKRTDQQLCEIIHELYNRGHQPTLLIQSDCDAADSDWQQAQRLRSIFPTIAVFDPFNAQPPVAAWDMLTGYLALANSVLAVRYHAAVLRLISGRVPYVLHYSNKGEDLCNRLNLPGRKLGHGNADEIVSQLELSADKLFDPAPLADHVGQSFADCISQIKQRMAA